LIRDEESHADVGHMTKTAFLQIQDGAQTPYWKSFFFRCISMQFWPIYAKYGEEMQNHMLTREWSSNFRKLKMADGRHFKNVLSPCRSCESSYFDQIWYADANFHSEDGHL